MTALISGEGARAARRPPGQTWMEGKEAEAVAVDALRALFAKYEGVCAAEDGA